MVPVVSLTACTGHLAKPHGHGCTAKIGFSGGLCLKWRPFGLALPHWSTTIPAETECRPQSNLRGVQHLEEDMGLPSHRGDIARVIP